MESNLVNELRINTGGRRAEDIFVIISKDGSTVVRDPGLSRPWHSPHKKLAEEHARNIGRGCRVVDLATAIKTVLMHPKNLPKNTPKGYKLPEPPN